MIAYQENAEREGNWLHSGVTNFLERGFVLYPEQKQIYHNLAYRLSGKVIIEAGCGIGVGTCMLSTKNRIVGTDKSQQQISFAIEMYPLCRFDLWDIIEWPYLEKAGGDIVPKFPDVVVAVEVIEHVKDFQTALDNLLASGEEAYVSTPNRNNSDLGQTRPINDLHVREFTPKEFVGLSRDRVKRILHWESFEELDEDTNVTPLVYHLC